MVRRIIGLAASLALCSACGVQGDLQRAEPLFGNPTFDAEATDLNTIDPDDLIRDDAPEDDEEAGSEAQSPAPSSATLNPGAPDQEAVVLEMRNRAMRVARAKNHAPSNDDSRVQ